MSTTSCADLDCYLQRIPDIYASMINDIKNKVIKLVYSKFAFQYMNFHQLILEKTIDIESAKVFFIEYLKEYKFGTYEILFTSKHKDPHQNVNVVICIEGKCLFIESIKMNFICEIIENTKNSYIRINNKKASIPNEEAETFYQYYYPEIKSQFVKNTIHSMIAYLYQRYYYPSWFFKDSSFFYFDQKSSSIESIIKEKLNFISHLKNKDEVDFKTHELFETLKQKVNCNSIQNNDSNIIYEFQRSEFLILRTLYKSIHLVLHLPSLYLFAFKKFEWTESSIKFINHEIEFCKNFSHRCFNRFYGFVHQNNDIVGVIYHFMSNLDLETFISNNPEKVDDFYIETVINRIFQGIEFLHSNSFIHRDIKPSNILIDHDYNIYISDFETVRKIDTNDDEIKFTRSFATKNYASPEQLSFEKISFPTDIYSFGLVVYFLNEKKDMFKDDDLNIRKIQGNSIIANMKKGSKEIQKFIQSCIEFDQKKRISINSIKKILMSTNSVEFLEKFLFQDTKKNLMPSTLIQYFTENIILRLNNIIQIRSYINYVILFFQIFLLKDDSKVFYELGKAYYDGKYVEKNYTKSLDYLDLSCNLNNVDALLLMGNFYILAYQYPKAIKYFEKAALQNNPKALYNLGFIYFYGKGGLIDYNKSLKYFERTISLNNDSNALFFLGLQYILGYGVRIDYNIAKNYFEQSALQNNPKSQTQLGQLYFNGQGVPQNYQMAKLYYEKAAFQNDPSALFLLAFLYDTGKGVKCDHKKAFDLYSISANLNNLNAYVLLGLHYLKGIGVEKNIEVAKQLLEISANNGNSKALFCLGTYYIEGHYTQSNPSLAIHYFNLSARHGNIEALNSLGCLYLNGKGVKINYPLAKSYFEQAAYKGNSNSIFNLGYIYFEGLGVCQNYKIAIQYFELAAMKNSSDALLILGMIYYYGYGVKKDYQKAKQSFEKSIQLLNANGYLGLGIHYIEGNGVEKSYSKAKECFEKAAMCDNPIAISNLGVIYLKGKGVKIDYEKAIKYFENASKLNYSDALINLGYIYYYGLGTVKDVLRAKFCLEKAIKNNNSQGLVNLGHIYFNEKNYSEAKKLYKLAAKKYNSFGYIYLALLYLKGLGVKKNYIKAEKFLELAAFEGNTDALYMLGLLYLLGNGVDVNYKKAKIYFELSAKKNDVNSLYYLGFLFENGKGVDLDIQNAIKYYKKCAEKGENDELIMCDYKLCESDQRNMNHYIANNDLGLIYITELNFYNIELAKKYIKEAAMNEYPFGQNNYGLFSLYYLNTKENAKYFFKKAAKNQFALAEFNLGHFYEEEGNKEKSIKHYILASNYENAIFNYRSLIISHDQRLNISKSFILCFTNLKLTQYYLNKNEINLNNQNSNQYFMKALFQPIFRFLFDKERNSFSFKFKFIKKENKLKLNNLKEFFLSFIMFKHADISNNKDENKQDEFSSKWQKYEQEGSNKQKLIFLQYDIEEDKSEKTISKYNLNNSNNLIDYDEQNKEFVNKVKEIFKIMNNQNDFEEIQDDSNIQRQRIDHEDNINKIQFKSKDDNILRTLKFSKQLCRLFLGNLNDIKDEIDDIINQMNSIIYKPPYSILFGRMKKAKQIENKRNIDIFFYDGFLGYIKNAF